MSSAPLPPASPRERLPAWVVWPLALTAVCWVAAGDYMTGAEVTFTLLYLGPIAFAVWFGGRLPGVVTGLASAAAWFAMDLLTREEPVEMSVRLWNLGGQLGVFLIVAVLLETIQGRLLRERRPAHTEDLTGLGNRRAFREALAHEIDRARRDHHPLTVACFDCDGFGRSGDRYGHERTDDALRSIAATLHARARRADAVGRLEGDTFGIVMPHTDAATARTLLDHLLDAVHAASHDPGLPRASVGAVTFLGAPPELETLLRRLDEVLAAAKRDTTRGLVHEVVAGNDATSLSLVS